MQGEKCANCGTVIDLNFCPNCGQKKFKRIDGKYIKDELQYTILHTNKGFFYSLKSIIKNPGKTTKDYLNGNRVNHYKPLLLVFVLSGISTFISYKILNMGEVMTEFFTENLKNNAESKASWDYIGKMYNYTTLIIMAFLPFLALSTYISFRKQGHNYYEHVIINSFYYVLFTLCAILIISPILFFVKDPQLYMLITTSSIIVAFPLMIWFYKGLYPQLSLGKIIWKSILVGIISFIFYIIISLAIGFAFALIMYFLK